MGTIYFAVDGTCEVKPHFLITHLLFTLGTVMRKLRVKQPNFPQYMRYVYGCVWYGHLKLGEI